MGNIRGISGTTGPTEVVHLSKCLEWKMMNSASGDKIDHIDQRLLAKKLKT